MELSARTFASSKRKVRSISSVFESLAKGGGQKHTPRIYEQKPLLLSFILGKLQFLHNPIIVARFWLCIRNGEQCRSISISKTMTYLACLAHSDEHTPLAERSSQPVVKIRPPTVTVSTRVSAGSIEIEENGHAECRSFSSSTWLRLLVYHKVSSTSPTATSPTMISPNFREYRYAQNGSLVIHTSSGGSFNNGQPHARSLRRRSSYVRDKWANKLEFLLGNGYDKAYQKQRLGKEYRDYFRQLK